MNVVIVNENRNIIDKLNIDIIKRIDGEYERVNGSTCQSLF